jgi:hypothetical protein
LEQELKWLTVTWCDSPRTLTSKGLARTKAAVTKVVKKRMMVGLFRGERGGEVRNIGVDESEATVQLY